MRNEEGKTESIQLNVSNVVFRLDSKHPGSQGTRYSMGRSR